VRTSEPTPYPRIDFLTRDLGARNFVEVTTGHDRRHRVAKAAGAVEKDLAGFFDLAHKGYPPTEGYRGRVYGLVRIGSGDVRDGYITP